MTNDQRPVSYTHLKEFNIVSLERLVALGEELLGSPITPDVLRKAGVIKAKHPVKILGDGELTVAITVHAQDVYKRQVYVRRSEIPRVLGGMGINILTTPRGVMTGRQARKEGVGGELLCEIW